ncbi:MAG: phytanoyl-CoA dioxygenase family protein [Acidobacteria bacterium]|nr:phytanoyl-CoA dioxygenase family protein [Acidobacteriota bacterium]
MRSITDLTRRFERRPLARRNSTYYLWRFAANGVRAGRALAMPATFDETRAIARELTAQGIVVGPSDLFLSDAGRNALAEAAGVVQGVSRSQTVCDILAGIAAHAAKKNFRVDLVKGAMRPDHPLLKVALDVKLLEIVATYLGMWPALHAVGAWLNYPTDEPAASSQLWHHDPEDLKVIKAFIYLEDVGEDNGPFTYVPGTHPFGPNVPTAQRHNGKRRLRDDQFTAVFPPSMWRVCTGPAGTMILADTIGYHRGGKPSTGTRLLVTFTYTSGTPIVAHLLRLKGEPTWISSAIQRYAIKRIELAPPQSDNGAKKQSTM